MKKDITAIHGGWLNNLTTAIEIMTTNIQQNIPPPRRKLIRLHNFDYTRPMYYYLTFVVNQRRHLLGTVNNGQAQLSDAGITVEQALENLPNRYEKTEVENHIIMPNHIHFVVYNGGQHYMQDMVRWLKSITTNRYIHGVKEQGWPAFKGTFWQHGYYEHVIRTKRAYENINRYIDENPDNWEISRSLPFDYLPQEIIDADKSSEITAIHGGMAQQ